MRTPSRYGPAHSASEAESAATDTSGQLSSCACTNAIRSRNRNAAGENGNASIPPRASWARIASSTACNTTAASASDHITSSITSAPSIVRLRARTALVRSSHSTNCTRTNCAPKSSRSSSSVIGAARTMRASGDVPSRSAMARYGASCSASCFANTAPLPLRSRYRGSAPLRRCATRSGYASASNAPVSASSHDSVDGARDDEPDPPPAARRARSSAVCRTRRTPSRSTATPTVPNAPSRRSSSVRNRISDCAGNPS